MENKAFLFKMLHPLYNIKETDHFSPSRIAPITNSAVQKSSIPPQIKTIRQNTPKHESKLLETYLPFLHIFRMIGICPITIISSQTSGGDEGPTCVFRYFSSQFLISVLGSFGMISLYLFGLPSRDAGLESAGYNFTLSGDENEIRDWTKYNSRQLLQLLRKLLPMQIPIITTANILISLVSTPKFVKILQNWMRFEKEFQKQLDSQKSPYANLYKVRNRVAGTYTVFGLVYGGLVIYVTRPPCDLTEVSCAIWERFMYAGIVIPYMLYTFLEDFKYVFMAKTVGEGFKQIAEKVKEYNGDILVNLRKDDETPHDVVTRWKHLLENVREQGRLVSECCSLHHLVSISNIFFSFVVCVYLSFVFQSGFIPAQTGIAYVAVGFCLAGFLRLFIKVKGSESIGHEERKLASLLNNVIIANDDIKTHIKINSIIDRVERDPTVITVFHSYSINTSLLFKLLGQAATYLIFLIQFDNMLQGDKKP